MSLPPLSPEQLVKPARFELRLSLIYAAILVAPGVHLPYFPLWLEAQGFDAQQIAVILSAPMFLRVVTTPFITAMADEARERANVLILLLASTLLISGGYFLKPTYLVILAVSLLLSVAWTPQVPMTDSLALSGVRRFGSSYAAMRIWGSISFLIANLGGGYILSHTGAQAVPAIITTALAFALGASLVAPRLGRPRRGSPLSAADMQVAAPKLMNRYFLLFIGGSGMILASHGFMYSFVSIYWKSIGLGDTIVGILWAWAVVAEVVMFMAFKRLFAHLSASRMIAMAGVAAIVRWIAYPLIWPLGLGVPGFFAVQTLHALSTALILLGVQKLIADTVAEERTGAAQGMVFFATGFAMAAVTLASGPLYDAFGVYGFIVMVGVAGLGLALIVFAGRSAPERRLGR
jgi:PPP family 3-phenylpropionic acid transporter